MKSNHTADIGVIGGTGIYTQELFSDVEEIKAGTPYGEPSDTITLGKFSGRRIAFLPRHGKGHRIPPHKINSQANIWALKELGVKRIIAPSAVGSLQTRYKPGGILIPDQFVDFTKDRKSSFYDGSKVCHISVADPFCPELRIVALRSLTKLGFGGHGRGTYICIEGPRFSTKAESRFFRQIIHGDIIGMTLIPECTLAREAEICYVSISTITDYDVWSENPVSSKNVMEILEGNVLKTKRLIFEMVTETPAERRKCTCGESLRDSIL
jgi:5'-methylthioadenosine phosphorylase